VYFVCELVSFKHNRSSKVAVQGLVFVAHPLYIINTYIHNIVRQLVSRELWLRHRNPEEGEHLLLAAITRRLVKTQQTEKT
jgi:hypothetical protein